jgi:hypothetical protein
VVPDPDYIKQMVDKVFNKVVEQGEAIRICCRSDDPECIIQFVPMKLSMINMSLT